MKSLPTVDIGFTASAALKGIKDIKILQFRGDCQKFLVDLCNKLLHKCPLYYKIVKGASCLSPAVMLNPPVRTYRITSALEVLLDKKQLSSVQADVVKRDYLVFVSKQEVIDYLEQFTSSGDQLDKFFMNIFSRIVCASGGIGREFAVQLAALGVEVICWGVDEEDILEAAREAQAINDNTGKAHSYLCDVMDRNKILESFLPSMIDGNNGHILALSSVAGLTGVKNQAALCASQFAVQGLVESLAEELRVNRCNGIHITLAHIYPLVVSHQLTSKTPVRILPRKVSVMFRELLDVGVDF
uniref:Uncharacterized protein n=1 Tax=Timema genevievae TaxID=629358 RepID=A0A7R9K3C2_TIMGE|nr:unnamed protein product [Timema genevievae]